MNLFGLMETSGSAMQAERMRAEVVAANMANAETTRTADGTPYRRQHVVFAANAGDSNFLDSMNIFFELIWLVRHRVHKFRRKPYHLAIQFVRRFKRGTWRAYCAGRRRYSASSQAVRPRPSRCRT